MFIDNGIPLESITSEGGVVHINILISKDELALYRYLTSCGKRYEKGHKNSISLLSIELLHHGGHGSQTQEKRRL